MGGQRRLNNAHWWLHSHIPAELRCSLWNDVLTKSHTLGTPRWQNAVGDHPLRPRASRDWMLVPAARTGRCRHTNTANAVDCVLLACTKCRGWCKCTYRCCSRSPRIAPWQCMTRPKPYWLETMRFRHTSSENAVPLWRDWGLNPKRQTATFSLSLCLHWVSLLFVFPYCLLILLFAQRCDFCRVVKRPPSCTVHHPKVSAIISPTSPRR